MNKKLDKMDAVVDRQVQYSRRNCFLVHGIVKETVEDTDEKIINTLQQRMDETIKSEDIDRSYRLGKPNSPKNAKPCPIIVKFVRFNISNRIYRNKKKLEGTGISVTESLTAKRIIMLEKAREEHTFNNVWSQHGKIMLFDKNTKLKLIIVNFFSAMSQASYGEKKYAVFIITLLRIFLLVLALYYILTYYVHQILGNAPLIVKIHDKNILFLSTIINQYFFFCNFHHYSIAEFSTTIKYINKISNYTII